jgi:hypothetical protein
MPFRISSKPKVDFSLGLVTEAHGLNFPENASKDELNVDLLRDGSRRRRKGISYETGYTDINLSYSVGDIVSVKKWVNAGAVPNLTFVVLQIRDQLRFFEIIDDNISSNEKSFTVDLSLYENPFGNGASQGEVEVTSIKGKLIVVSPEINSIEINYDPSLDTIIVQEIQFNIRDFDWQGDKNTYDTSILLTDPSLVGDGTRRYDTLNSGWSSSPLSTYESTRLALPPLTHPWYSGKNASGVFSVAEWEKVYSGSSLIVNGHYILDLYNQLRTTASGLTNVTNYVEQTRFRTVEAFSGRLFYAGMTSAKYTDTVFFSQIINDFGNAGELLQTNDPTSEEISDVLATDGGAITIEGCYNIKKLHRLGPALLVFADNGVWQIRGVDNIFKATDYAVTKISDAGLKYEKSFVSAQGRPYWWSSNGIFTLRASEESQVLSGINLTIDRIQTKYDAISKREQVRGAYDTVTGKLFWFYPSANEPVEDKLREVIIFDERRSAFVPWQIADASSYVLDAIYLQDDATVSVNVNVIDSLGNIVQDSSGDDVIIARVGRAFYSSALKVLCLTNTGGISFAEFTAPTFKDWGSVNYQSYIEGAYDFLGSLSLKKGGVYLIPFFNVTESELVDTAGVLDFDTPSGCFVTSSWDFKRVSTQTPQQAYRLKKVFLPSSAGTFEYPEEVISPRLRIRGLGAEVHFRFSSEDGKDFHLLGYDFIFGTKESL